MADTYGADTLAADSGQAERVARLFHYGLDLLAGTNITPVADPAWQRADGAMGPVQVRDVAVGVDGTLYIRGQPAALPSATAIAGGAGTAAAKTAAAPNVSGLLLLAAVAFVVVKLVR